MTRRAAGETRSASWRAAEIVELIANLVAPLALIVSIGVFWTQRSDQRQEREAERANQEQQDRRNAAMQFVMLKHQDAYLTAASMITDAFGGPDARNAMEQLRGADRKQWFDDMTARAGLKNFRTMGDLYQSIIACRAARTCDPGVIDAAFHTEITQFYRLARESALPALTAQLNDEGKYGARLAAYVSQTLNRPSRDPASSAP